MYCSGPGFIVVEADGDRWRQSLSSNLEAKLDLRTFAGGAARGEG